MIQKKKNVRRSQIGTKNVIYTHLTPQKKKEEEITGVPRTSKKKKTKKKNAPEATLTIHSMKVNRDNDKYSHCSKLDLELWNRL